MSEQPSCSRIPVCLTPECVNVGSRLRGFSVIVATDVESGIARNGAIPWHSTEDLKHFRELTSRAAKGKKCCVIMGRRTWDSIPPQHRPLKNRINVVLSRSSPPPQLPPDVYFVNGPLSSVLHSLAIGSETVFCNCSEVDRVWVIGGAQVYQEALDPLGSCCSSIRSVFRTVVGANPHGCDLKLPSLPALLSQNDFVLEDRQAVHESASGEDSLVFEQWNRRNTQEEGYLGLCREIIDHGNVKSDRTGVGTRSIFGAQMRFSLRDGRLPLLTTKRVFWRGVCEELLWFVRGETDARVLQSKGIHIWDGNASREFLDSRGLFERPEGDLGPVYGFQWRHFGAKYAGTERTQYDGQGVDQLRAVVELLKNHPDDRRILMSAWNPMALDDMALPPCHVLAQFYVSPQRELSCLMYQRSCDMGLGVPFNLASYALLTVLLARASGLQPGELIHTLGDAHVYNNHIDAIREQLTRVARPFPRLVILQDHPSLEDYAFEDFALEDYDPMSSISMEMAV